MKASVLSKIILVNLILFILCFDVQGQEPSGDLEINPVIDSEKTQSNLQKKSVSIVQNESGPATETSKPKAEATKTTSKTVKKVIKRKVKKIVKKTTKKPPTTTPKKRFKKELDWEGTLKFAFRFAKNRERRAENKAGFEVSSLNLEAEYHLERSLTLKAWYQIDPVESELREAYARYQDEDAFFDWIQMGFQRRLFHLSSELETDSLNKIALYKLRDPGIQARVSFLDRWYWPIALSNGGQLDDQDISPRRVTDQDVILSDDFDPRQAVGSNSREIITGIGYNRHEPDFNFEQLHVLLFASVRSITDDDVEDLETLSDIPGFTGTNTGTTSYAKVGVNVTVKYRKWESYSQYAVAKVRDLERQLFASEISYTGKTWKPVFAFSQQTLNIEPDFTAPLTWGRQRFTFGLHYKWLQHADIAMELTINNEDTGGDTVNNDELIVMWIYSFEN